MQSVKFTPTLKFSARQPNQLSRNIITVIIHPGVALIVNGVSTAVEVHVVAVVVGVVSVDVDTRVIAVRRGPMTVARTLLKILSGAAGALRVVVATTLQEIAANHFTCG